MRVDSTLLLYAGNALPIMYEKAVAVSDSTLGNHVIVDLRVDLCVFAIHLS